MFKSFGAPEILLILVLVLLLFGAKRLPDAARGLGRSMRIFKSEVSAMKDDETTTDAAPTSDSAPTTRTTDTTPTPSAPEQQPGATDAR